MPLISMTDKDKPFLDVDAMESIGENLQDKYLDALPFPNIVIDEFLEPSFLEKCIREFPTSPDPSSASFARTTENLKTSYSPEYMHSDLRALFYTFNSLPFIKFLEGLTGIKGLIPDPYFEGGGFHETKNGGHLSVHADFNFHKKLGLERRINVLIYLNKDWEETYGGHLELWENDMSRKVVGVSPVFNRAVIFNTTSTSNHGQPDPICHPQGVSRRSIALYYYTATWEGDKRKHTTQFRVRPGSTDKFDSKVWIREKIADIMPPILMRALRKIKHS